VISQGRVIHLIDFKSGKTIRDFANRDPAGKSDWETVLGIAFSADGKLMASGGFNTDNGIYFARLWDVATGKELRRFMHGKQSYGIPSLAFSPDGKTLATRSHDGRLRLFAVDSGKPLRTFPADGGGRKQGAVAFAPDGRTVVAAGDAIRVYEVRTGTERLRIDRKQASHLYFTDGGQTLTAAVDGAIYRWDTTTGKVLTPEAGDSSVEQVLVSADGSRVVTRGVCEDAHIWDGKTGQHLRRLQAGLWPRGMAISPDGRFLAWAVDDYGVTFTDPQEPAASFYGMRIRFYDIASGKSVDRIATFKGQIQDLTFTNDGKKLVTAEGPGGRVRIWNVATGQEERSFPAVPEVAKDLSYSLLRTVISPNGETVVKTYVKHRGGVGQGPLLVQPWDVATGKELPPLRDGLPVDRAFSPDGRFVVARVSQKPPAATSGDYAVSNGVYEVATGNRVTAWPDEVNLRAAAFSRDGRFLATAVGGGVIQIWEVATWTRRNNFKDQRSQPSTLTFAPSGQLLSGCQDTTVLAWDMRPPRVASSVTLESAWNDLARRDAAVPYRSEGRFLAAPAEAVTLFAEGIKAAEALDRTRVERLLADLDSKAFAVREAASKALTGLGEQATPYLEKTLKDTDSPEVRIRVTRILKKRREAAIPADRIRQIRAVMVLERIGDGAAKDVLKRWAGGPAGARLTMEAAAALKRLDSGSNANR
jgi:WD40 repeat protein